MLFWVKNDTWYNVVAILTSNGNTYYLDKSVVSQLSMIIWLVIKEIHILSKNLLEMKWNEIDFKSLESQKYIKIESTPTLLLVNIILMYFQFVIFYLMA